MVSSAWYPLLHFMAPSGSVLGNVLPAAGVDLRASQISLADIFEAQQRSANATDALPQFAIEYFSRKTVGFYAVHVAEPSKVSLAE